MKKCSSCSNYWPLSNYSPKPKAKDGVQPYCKHCDRDRKTLWNRNNREKIKRYKKVWKQSIKDRVFGAYGGKCVCCKEDNSKFLTIDHIFNDGAIERKLFKTKMTGIAMYMKLVREGCPKSRYQILCFNCNCGKANNNGVCPHQLLSKTEEATETSEPLTTGEMK